MRSHVDDNYIQYLIHKEYRTEVDITRQVSRTARDYLYLSPMSFLATVGVATTVIPKRSGSVNLVATQATASVANLGFFSR